MFSRDRIDDLVGSLPHQAVELLSRTAAAGRDSHHGGTSVLVRAPHTFDESAGLQLLKNPSHGAWSNPRTGCKIGNSCALLGHKSSEDGALTLTKTFATDLIGANLTKNPAEPFELVPPLSYRLGISLHTGKGSAI